MPEQKIKCLIFDCGKVLVAFDVMIICRKLTAYSAFSSTQIFAAIYGQGLLFSGSLHHQYETGQLTTLEFFRQVKKAIQANDDLTLEKFREIAKSIYQENSAIKKILDHVKLNFKLVLLSNNNELSWGYLRQLSVVKDYFKDGDIFLSFRVGAKKPNPAIYQAALANCGCQASEAIFIDDEPRNIDGFAKLGVRGIKYNCQTDSLEKLAANLTELGIFKKSPFWKKWVSQGTN